MKRPTAKPPPTARVAPVSELARARAALAEVKRDASKRKFRHHWERAIASLERAARGRDTGAALLDAARARYALYRFSQVDSDRTKALALAAKAEKLGVPDARALRLAIRQEMGEAPEREPVKPRPAASAVATRSGTPAARPKPAPAPAQPARIRPPPPDAEPRLAESKPRAPESKSRSSESSPRSFVSSARTAESKPRGPPAVTPPRSTGGQGDEEASIDAILARALAGEGAAPDQGAPPERAAVAEIKSWPNHDYTRVAIYLSRNVSYQRVDLPAEPGVARRVALDLRPARLDSGIAHSVGDALVRRVRAEQLDPDTVRVTLELSGREDLAVFPLEDPSRLIVDVGAAPSPGVAAGPPPRDPQPPPVAGAPAAPSRDSRPAAPPVLAPSDEITVRGPIRRVIVDAGHGGHDTGAIGPTNVREKDVTLAMARRVAKRLRARGYEVVLTRDDDRYLALEERTAIANARHGDLFVSLHANAHPRRDRRGVETYVLNVADDRYAARLAARENGAFEEGSADIPLLRRVLSDLDAKVSVESSRRVASAVQRELCAGIRARFGEVRDLGVKSALFYVLLGARMPAVLVETAFISNRAEERRLASATFQEEVAAAVVRAVEQVGAGGARIAAAR